MILQRREPFTVSFTESAKSQDSAHKSQLLKERVAEAGNRTDVVRLTAQRLTAGPSGMMASELPNVSLL